MKGVRQPNTSDLNVSRQGIWRNRDRLDASLRMFPRIAANKRKPGAKWHLTDAETDDAVGDVGWQFVAAAALNRGRT